MMSSMSGLCLAISRAKKPLPRRALIIVGPFWSSSETVACFFGSIQPQPEFVFCYWRISFFMDSNSSRVSSPLAKRSFKMFIACELVRAPEWPLLPVDCISHRTIETIPTMTNPQNKNIIIMPNHPIPQSPIIHRPMCQLPNGPGCASALFKNTLLMPKMTRHHTKLFLKLFLKIMVCSPMDSEARKLPAAIPAAIIAVAFSRAGVVSTV